jgi:hypothetical protein
MKNIIHINPKMVNKISTNTFFKIDKPTHVDGGDWDINGTLDIKDFVIYKSINSLINEKTKWEETELYQWIVDGLNKGEIKWACDSLAACNHRGQYIINLYSDIKRIGKILLRDDILKREDLKSRNTYLLNDDIQVVVGRNGEILFAKNGSHRFCIAKMLDFNSIPVRVYRRHVEWEEYRKYIKSVCDKLWKNKTYQEIPHPDFSDITPMHPSSRYELIKSNTDLKNVKLLDIGSLFGYICYKAEQDGYQCTAVEIDELYLSIMRKLHDACHMQYRIFGGTIFDIDDKEHDIIIAFNIFHHFLKTKKDHERLINLLNELTYKEMFIQFHRTDEPQMIGAYKNYTEEEFAEFIVNNSKNKTAYKCIGEENGRKIYKIY